MALTIQERLKDLRLSDDMIDLLKSGRIDTALLCKLADKANKGLFILGEVII